MPRMLKVHLAAVIDGTCRPACGSLGPLPTVPLKIFVQIPARCLDCDRICDRRRTIESVFAERLN